MSDWPLEEALSFAKIALQCAELRRKDGPDLGKAVLPELNRMREFSEELLDPQARPVLHGHLSMGTFWSRDIFHFQSSLILKKIFPNFIL